jgi:hypothetical protein
METRMPRYFLNIEYENSDNLRDLEGAEFQDIDAALVEADKALRELVSAVISSDRMEAPTSIIILDEAGLRVGQVTTGDLIRKTFQI